MKFDTTADLKEYLGCSDEVANYVWWELLAGRIDLECLEHTGKNLHEYMEAMVNTYYSVVESKYPTASGNKKETIKEADDHA